LKNDSTIINDLRRTNQFVVSTEDAEALRKEIKAHCYIGIFPIIFHIIQQILTLILISLKKRMFS
jgi:hypothetical protein